MKVNITLEGDPIAIGAFIEGGTYTAESEAVGDIDVYWSKRHNPAMEVAIQQYSDYVDQCKRDEDDQDSDD